MSFGKGGVYLEWMEEGGDLRLYVLPRQAMIIYKMGRDGIAGLAMAHTVSIKSKVSITKASTRKRLAMEINRYSIYGKVSWYSSCTVLGHLC